MAGETVAKLKQHKGLVIGGAAVSVIGLWYYEKKNKAASATNTGTTGTANGIDPATGFPYGSPQDQAAQSGQGGAYGGIDPTTGIPYSEENLGYGGQSVGYGSYAAGGSPYGYSSPPVATATTPGITTAAEWAADVTPKLIAAGYNPGAVSIALGRYFTHGTLTSEEYSIVDSAIGIDGPAPGIPAPSQTGGGSGQGGGGGGKRRWQYKTLDGKYTLEGTAQNYHTSRALLVSWNPSLGKYFNSKKHIPAGTRIRIPA